MIANENNNGSNLSNSAADENPKVMSQVIDNAVSATVFTLDEDF